MSIGWFAHASAHRAYVVALEGGGRITSEAAHPRRGDGTDCVHAGESAPGLHEPSGSIRASDPHRPSHPKTRPHGEDPRGTYQAGTSGSPSCDAQFDGGLEFVEVQCWQTPPRKKAAAQRANLKLNRSEVGKTYDPKQHVSYTETYGGRYRGLRVPQMSRDEAQAVLADAAREAIAALALWPRLRRAASEVRVAVPATRGWSRRPPPPRLAEDDGLGTSVITPAAARAIVNPNAAVGGRRSTRRASSPLRRSDAGDASGVAASRAARIASDPVRPRATRAAPTGRISAVVSPLTVMIADAA
eukprot:tig00000385_g24765.t1